MITLKTLANATEQQIFDQVVTHLANQNDRAVGAGTCLYRTDKGLKCAAGCLISDDEYVYNEFDEAPPSGTGTSWDSLAKRNIVPEQHVEFINELQKIHDQNEFEWLRTMYTSFAENRKLDVTVLNGLPWKNQCEIEPEFA